MELLESNNLLAGWSGFKLRSTPLQSKKITVHHPPLLKKPAFRRCPLLKKKEEKRKEKKFSIWRSIAMTVDIGLAVVL